MINLNESAAVVAINLTILWGGLRVCAAWVPWIRKAWKALREEPLGMLPLSVVWLVLWVAIESLYYSAARITMHLSNGEENMWEDGWVVVIVAIRLAVLFGMVAHVIPKWRVDGIQGSALHTRVLGFTVELGLIFALFFVVLL